MARPIRYPTGVRPLLVEAAARRRRIEHRFVDVLERAGFSEVILPVLDYVDVYAALPAAVDAAKQSYRFVDRNGELVALRSDFTPMVARALAPELCPDELPLRVYYRGDVIRCDPARLGANRELFQIGAEIIGDDSLQADITALRLAATLADDATIVYTDARVLSSLASTSPAVAEALISKRSSAEPLAAKLLAGTATIDDVRPFAPEAAQRLASLAATLDDRRFVLHLGDAEDDASYYTGIRFAVYGGPLRSKIAQGGRYDTLYERFGAAATAIGFTFTIDDLD
jgi:ATP phosphoribosyltransferase regulatory subunit